MTDKSQGNRNYSIDTPEFDLNTYWGRFEEFRATANPLHAFYTNKRILSMKKQLEMQDMREMVEKLKTGKREIPMTTSDIEELKLAKIVTSTAIHPDTGRLLPWLFRFSSFLPVNVPISFGFIFAAPTPFNTIFWQWINQTYNAALNYENRNASSKYTAQDIATSYCLATSSAICVALGMRKAVAKQAAKLKGGKLVMLNACSAFAACAAAGFLNAYFMRQTEMKNGIDVLDTDTHEPYGKSVISAKKAVLQTATSRIFLVLTIFLPPALLLGLEKFNLMPKWKPLKLSVEISLLVLELYFAVPLGLALFPQYGSLKASELEPEFQNLTNKNGDKIQEFCFNKGL